MALTKAHYRMIEGSPVNVKDFGAVGDGVTDDTAAIQAATLACETAKKGLFFPSGTYLVSDTIICKTNWHGENSTNYWQGDETGTIIKTTGAGTGARWTDITGSDAATFTPAIVVGRSDVTLRDLTIECGTTAWSAGIFLPCVKRTQLTNVDCIGEWSEAGLYLDVTWSDRNTTLKALHPTVTTDTGMNETVVYGGFFEGEDWGVKVQGTTRDPDSYTSETWIWGWGGASDTVFTGCRTSSISLDAPVKNTAKAVQGLRFYSVDTRCADREYMLYFGSVNRVEWYGSYGEASEGDTAKIGFTSDTGSVIFFGGNYIRNTVWLDGSDTGVVLGNVVIPTIPTLSFYTYDGEFYLGGGLSTNGDNLFNETTLTGSLGSSSKNWLNVRAERLISDSGPLKLQANTNIIDLFDEQGEIGISGNLYIDGLANETGLQFRASDIVPRDNGALVDDAVDLGDASYRFDDVFATNGTIQTSDRNEKQDIEELSAAERNVAVACKSLLRKFRWINSVNEKGDNARIHFGIIAQDLQDAFTAEGLDAGRYAMFTSDTWTDEETGQERTRLGVRYPQLLAFIIGAM